MENERRDREKEIQKANKEVLDKFAVHQKQFEVEKVTRLQREALLEELKDGELPY